MPVILVFQKSSTKSFLPLLFFASKQVVLTGQPLANRIMFRRLEILSNSVVAETRFFPEKAQRNQFVIEAKNVLHQAI